MKSRNTACQGSSGTIRASHGLNGFGFISLRLVGINVYVTNAICEAFVQHLNKIINLLLFLVHWFHLLMDFEGGAAVTAPFEKESYLLRSNSMSPANT